MYTLNLRTIGTPTGTTIPKELLGKLRVGAGDTVYVTEDRSDSFLEKMGKDLGARAEDVICFGHTHKPWQRVVGGIQFINTGSVGRPKDGDPRACYASLAIDGSGARVEFVRVAYNIDEAAHAIRESNLPDEFAEVLRSGGVPSHAEI